MKRYIALITSLMLLMSASAIAEKLSPEEAGYAHSDAGDANVDTNEKPQVDNAHEEEGGAIKLTSAQIKQAGIKSEIVKLRPAPQTVIAPGTVDFNAYQLADVSTLVDGVIRVRHVRLGDKVKKGEQLLTLSSSALAQSEADYLRAEAEHKKSKLELQRIETLAKENIVSQARLQQADSLHQAAHANLAASRAALASYGLSAGEIDALIQSNKYGQLTLDAPNSGTIIEDNFRIGQYIAAGTRLMQIVDESSVWVEVKLPQSRMSGITTGRAAMVSIQGDKHLYRANIINIHHQLDQTTRTVGVRLEVENPDDALHSGMFVNAEIEVGSGEESLLLPAAAVQRQGSELIVFVEEEPGHFERREVNVGRSNMGFVSITEGLKAGESVVVQGAFVLVSELAKSGFEVHNH